MRQPRARGPRILFIGLVLLVGALVPPGRAANDITKEETVTADVIDDSVFFRQSLGSGDPCECTPPMEPDERGIRIAAPRRVRGGGELIVPVCAVARFEYAERDTMPANLWPEMVAVAIDLKSNRSFCARLGEPSPPPGDEISGPEPGEPPGGGEDDDAADLSGQGSITQYRTFDLVPVLELPSDPAVYHCFLIFRAHASNSVRIEVFAPEGGRP